ncbi:MAG: methyltransferase domain-containing protein [Candidatus Magnetobacterium sp. LHC-1]|uniref:Methyltransferase domain-containing protein n=1 Tax=Candidatus Magnetobacterium casense TaxID=1455061 RepID=A0ABS6S1T6_9BACT|nr:methyltransferase domain-containing protein [Candidatus Magnetobacterium casensis]MBF0607632.1 methyltransferase domain-containing protein [Nitrospirota bacterium]MBV6342771.1 methyltransferase domain-containing protein [Candidatus Magnetobacterium casensis]
MEFDLKNKFKQLSFNTFIPFFYPMMMLPLRGWRKKAIQMCSFRPADRVIIPGIGSGYDLPYLPNDVVVDGVDISEVMLGIAAAKLKLQGNGQNIRLTIMDAEHLDFPADTFDKAILDLFLTCVYDPQRAFAEVVRVMKPNGEILIYDHLIRTNKWTGTMMSYMDTVMKYNFCSVIRPFDDIIQGQPVEVVREIKGDPLGFIRGFLLRKTIKKVGKWWWSRK